jgi:hypothetical protein
MNASTYNLIWLHTVYDLDNFNLYLYSNQTYNLSYQVAKSELIIRRVDWIVYRPSSDQVMYPLAYTTKIGLGSLKGAYIEAESATGINFDIYYEIDMEATESGELFYVNLEASQRYCIDLGMPEGCDFELYIFRLAPGSTEKQDYGESENGISEMERIWLTPSYTDQYAIVVIWYSGSGTGMLMISPKPTSGIPSFEISLMLLALMSLIVLNIKRDRKVWSK